MPRKSAIIRVDRDTPLLEVEMSRTLEPLVRVMAICGPPFNATGADGPAQRPAGLGLLAGQCHPQRVVTASHHGRSALTLVKDLTSTRP
jgi:hypothetical protein